MLTAGFSQAPFQPREDGNGENRPQCWRLRATEYSTCICIRDTTLYKVCVLALPKQRAHGGGDLAFLETGTASSEDFTGKLLLKFYTSTSTAVYTCVYTRARMCTSVYTHVHICVCLYLCQRLYLHLSTPTSTSTVVYTYVHVYIWCLYLQLSTSTSTSAAIAVYTSSVSVLIMSVYICIYVYHRYL